MNEKYKNKIQEATHQAAKERYIEANPERNPKPKKQQTPGWAHRRNIIIALAVLVCAAAVTIFAAMGEDYDIRVSVDWYGNAYVYPAGTYHHSVQYEDGSIRMTVSTGGGRLNVSLPQGWSYEVSEPEQYITAAGNEYAYEDSGYGYIYHGPGYYYGVSEYEYERLVTIIITPYLGYEQHEQYQYHEHGDGYIGEAPASQRRSYNYNYYNLNSFLQIYARFGQNCLNTARMKLTFFFMFKKRSQKT